MNIVRTETHRVQESGFMDCAKDISKGLEGSGLIYTVTWRTMKDQKVRPSYRIHTPKGWKTVVRKTTANHQKMEGVTIRVGDKFEIEPGVFAECPGSSGTARNDCNCRCYLEYELMSVEEFAKATGKSVGEVEKEVAKGEKDIENSAEKEFTNVDNDDIIKLKDNIADADKQIEDLKKQFSEITEGYSYDEWFSEFKSIEEGFGDISDENAEAVQKLKDISQRLEDAKQERLALKSKLPKRGQLDTGYEGHIPDDKLDEYNKKALQQIKLDTGYSDEKAAEFQKAMLDYFGGDYEAILTGNTKEAKIIKDGIERMPAYDGKIYRGLLFDKDEIKAFSELNQGDTLPAKGIISSWSSNERVSISFASPQSCDKNSVILVCEDNITGAGVQHISKFGTSEAEVLSSANYEVVEVIIENKYDYLAKHEEYLWTSDQLDWEGDKAKENVVCIIKVKEKN